MGLNAPAETEAVLYLSYVVSNASWNSAYDVRVFTKDQAMKVMLHNHVKSWKTFSHTWDIPCYSMLSLGPTHMDSPYRGFCISYVHVRGYVHYVATILATIRSSEVGRAD